MLKVEPVVLEFALCGPDTLWVFSHPASLCTGCLEIPWIPSYRRLIWDFILIQVEDVCLCQYSTCLRQTLWAWALLMRFFSENLSRLMTARLWHVMWEENLGSETFDVLGTRSYSVPTLSFSHGCRVLHLCFQVDLYLHLQGRGLMLSWVAWSFTCGWDLLIFVWWIAMTQGPVERKAFLVSEATFSQGHGELNHKLS